MIKRSYLIFEWLLEPIFIHKSRYLYNRYRYKINMINRYITEMEIYFYIANKFYI